MSETISITIKKKTLLLIISILFSLVILILVNQHPNASNVDIQNQTPIPTKTVFIPNQGDNYSWNNDTQNQLDEIRAQNCRLSQDLLFQSLELSRQANDLEWASDGIENSDQIERLRNQATNLMFKSQELSGDC